jgi:Asp-tRNA(Asn)/Glu-tRNA(Gln) amidotransferase C subunit
VAAFVGVPVADEQVESFARGLARIRAYGDELRALDLDGVVPWTPPS